MKNNHFILKGAGVLAVVFGLMTLKSSYSVLFIDGEFRANAGNYVLFVVWFNFCAGFFYVLTGFLLFKVNRFALTLSAIVAGLTLITYLLFGLHVWADKPYEMQTVVAMAIRFTFWCTITLLCYFKLPQKEVASSAM